MNTNYVICTEIMADIKAAMYPRIELQYIYLQKT